MNIIKDACRDGVRLQQVKTSRDSKPTQFNVVITTILHTNMRALRTSMLCYLKC